MFDTRKTGAKIMQLRKEKDMTQMELADLMQVSYQAVSNWERGNSMPDISKLADLAHALGVSIDELLDSSSTARTIRKVMDDEQTLSINEIASVAPILKPSSLNQNIEKAGLEDIAVQDLVELAPYLSENKLMFLIQNAGISKIEDLLPFAPFLDSRQLMDIVNEQEDLQGNLSALTAFAPFLDEEDLETLATRLIQEDDDCSTLLPFAPHMSSKSLMALIQKTGFKNLSELVGFAPFLDSGDIYNLLEQLAEPVGNLDGLIGLAPFMDEDDLSRITEKLIGESDFRELVIPLAPHLCEETLQKVAKECFATGDLKTLKAILPFIDSDGLE